MEIKGIDVSKYQGIVDWNKVKAAGIYFVMIRCSYGKLENQIDSCFKTNIQGAQAAGLKVGVYHYSYAQSVAEAVQEAQVCLNAIKGYKLDYPVAFDIEDDTMTHLSRTTLTEIAKAFLQTVTNAGYKAVLYANPNWIQNYLYLSQLTNWDLWLAQYATSPTTAYKYTMWQYSQSGTINGIQGNVDLDIGYKDYSATETKVQIDTTQDMTMAQGAFYTIKTTCPTDVTLTAGSGGVVAVLRCRREGNYNFFHVYAIGKSGDKTGIYTCTSGEQPVKRFVISIK